MPRPVFLPGRLLLIAWWLGACPALAQAPLRLRADSVVARSGDTVAVAVRVSGFQQMLTAQGTLAFDSTIVEAVSVTPGALNGLSAANFGQLGRTRLTFAWFDPAVAGQSLPDSTVLFSVRFRVVGSAGQRSSLHFTDAPTLVEFTRVGFLAVTPVRVAGVVRVTGTSGLSEATASGFSFYPNPATDALVVGGANAVWLTEVGTGRRYCLRPAPDGRLDLRQWPAGTYRLAPVGAPAAAQPLLLLR